MPYWKLIKTSGTIVSPVGFGLRDARRQQEYTKVFVSQERKAPVTWLMCVAALILCQYRLSTSGPASVIWRVTSELLCAIFIRRNWLNAYWVSVVFYKKCIVEKLVVHSFAWDLGEVWQLKKKVVKAVQWLGLAAEWEFVNIFLCWQIWANVQILCLNRW